MTRKLVRTCRQARLWTVLVLIGAIGIITACSGGGGGGGGGGTPPPPPSSNPTMTVTASGAGNVNSAPAGINQCSETTGVCQAAFTPNSQVMLTPNAGQGSAFSGWNGACSGTGQCAPVMSGDLNVHAIFIPLPSFTLTVTTSGTGTVNSSPAGINQCSGTCQASFPQGTQVTLTPTPGQGFTFNSWAGGCSGSAGCAVTMTTDVAVQAIFSAQAGFDFSLSVAPPSQSVVQGAAASYTVTATLLNAPAGPVTLTVQSGCPVSATCTFSPNPVTPAPAPGVTSQLTVSTSGGTPTGTTSLVIRGTNGGLIHEVSAQLTVTSQVGPIQNPPRFSYVPNNSDGTLSIYAVNATTGQLWHQGYVKTGLLPVSAAVSSNPNGTFVYTANQTQTGTVSGFVVNLTTGQLTSIAGSPFTAGTLTSAVAAHPNGQFLYAVNFSSQGQPVVSEGTVSAFTINATTGVLAPIGSAIAAGKSPTAMAITPNGQFAYVANFSSNTPQLTAFSIQPGGALSPLALQNIPVSPAASITINPAGTFLFTANEISDSVTSYAINPNGTLTSVQTRSTGTDPSSVAVDPTGQFLYVSNEFTRDVSAFRVQANGTLTSLGAPFAVGAVPKSVSVDPSGQFVYTTNYGDQPGSLSNNSVTSFAINPASGALTKLGVTRARQEPSAMAFVKGPPPVTFTPTFAYVANQGSNTISGFSINPANGQLSPAPGGASTATTVPSAVAILPGGKFLYVSNELQQGQVSGFSIGATGGLTPVPVPSVGAGTNPHAAAADPSSRFVFVVNQGSGNVSCYKVAANGNLSAIACSGTTGGSPVSVTVDPTGQFLYTANRTGGNVTAFKIDGSDGTLLPTGATPNPGNNPEAVTIDPTGRFVYVAASLDGKVYGFNVDPVSGGLTAIQGSPFTAGSFATAVAAEPTGKYLFVANRDANTLSVFRIDATTGALTPVGPAVAVGTRPDAVTVDVSGGFVYVGVLGPANPVGPGTVAGFALNLGTGALTPVPGSPFAVGTTPVSVGSTGTIQ